MDECILVPSPNWFQASGLAVSRDGWLIYGGPNKGLCVLEPLPADAATVVEGERYRVHELSRAHSDRIVTVDITPEWPEKKLILTGSADGTVKQWIFESSTNNHKFRSTYSHDSHQKNKEEVVGVGYSNEVCAISVGNFGHLVKWDLKSNVVKAYKNFLKGFKPTCMACSPHILLHLAVGTKQGVIFIMDLNAGGNILHKIRCHDDEVVNLSWCPQYEVLLKKALQESDKKVSANERMAKIRQEAETTSENLNQSFATKTLPEDSFDESIVAEDDTFDIYTDHEMDLFGPNKYIPKDVLVKIKRDVPVDDNYLAECLKLKEFIVKGKPESQDMASLVDAMEKTHVENEQKEHTDDASQSNNDVKNSDLNGEANLPKPSQELETEQEDQEFNSEDYGSNNLAQALEEKHPLKEQKDGKIEGITNGNEKASSDLAIGKKHVKNKQKNLAVDLSDGDSFVHGNASFHVHRHLLATIGKQGGVRIWSKSGKRIGHCNVIGPNKNQKSKLPVFPTLLWYKVDCLLIGDGKSQLVQCNPLHIDCRNKLEYRVVHSFHKKGLFCIASDAPKVQVPVDKNKQISKPTNWSVWTCSQDRSMIKYSMESKVKSEYESCGGFVYMIQSCPYDAKKIAVAVGDGAVRIWEADTTYNDDTKLCAGTVATFWQNVQGKVQTITWHPTREHLLAFGTGEARVGLIDSGKGTVRTLVPVPDGPVYCLCWGEGDHLYAGGKGRLMVYNTLRTDEHPKPVTISLEGHQWEIASIRRFVDRLYAVGSIHGGVAVVDESNSYEVLAANLVYTKTIYNVECHPQQTSESNDKSRYHNLIAVSAVDKLHAITLLEYVTNEDGTKLLQTWKVLMGHKNAVLQLAWNPHRDELLVSTSQDNTIRVWDVEQGACVSVFDGHGLSAVSAIWSPRPQLHDFVLSGGHDCALRLWRYTDYPADQFTGVENASVSKREKKKLKLKKEGEKAEEVNDAGRQAHPYNFMERVKMPKKYLMPITSKQISNCSIKGARKMLQHYIDSNAKCVNGKMDPLFRSKSNLKIEYYVEDNKDDLLPNEKLSAENEKENSNEDGCDDDQKDEKATSDEVAWGIDFIKMFGSTNDVNEILDLEMSRHLEANNYEAWIVLCILRGHIDTMMQFASSRDILCPYLVSIAPCVSFKYWKDATQLYLAQIDRLVAKGEEEKLYGFRAYGGTVNRKVGSLLSIHDVKGAVDTFIEAGLYKEAYILCRTRHMDSIAQETLRKWAKSSFKAGYLIMAAICYLALGELSEAVSMLSKSEDPQFLSLAADIAKVAGHTTYANQIEERTSNIMLKETVAETEDPLEELPTRMELLLRNKTTEEETMNGET